MATKIQRRIIDNSQEKNLITNLITSSEFCREILQILNPRLLSSEHPKLAFKWIKDYYQKYGEAPKSNLETLFLEAAIGVEKNTFELMVKYLSGLSDNYKKSENVNVSFEIDQAREYLSRRSLETTIEDARSLIKNNRSKDAKKLIKKYSQDIVSSTNIKSAIQNCIIGEAEFFDEKIEKPVEIISPWLTDGSISMIYAPRGIGKTWLALYIATIVTRKSAMGRRIGPWEVEQQAGCLYVDGEMGEYELQARRKQLSTILGPEDNECRFDQLSAARFAKDYGKQINISKEEFRNTIYQHLKENEQYNLLVLDNIASLTPGIDENSKGDWDPINQWLISLRHLNVAVIFIHHSGKNPKSGSRGTSGREDALDCIIKLSKLSNYKANNGCKFKVQFEKSRNVSPGVGLNPFIFHLLEDEETGGLILNTDGMDKDENQVDAENIIKGLLLQNELKQKQIAKTMGVSPTTVGNIKKELASINLIAMGKKTTEWTITSKGMKTLEMIREDYNLDDYSL